MLKKFINWFRVPHDYNGNYISVYHYGMDITVIPTARLVFNSVLDNGIYLEWLTVSIWIHAEMY